MRKRHRWDNLPIAKLERIQWRYLNLLQEVSPEDRAWLRDRLREIRHRDAERGADPETGLVKISTRHI